ncbi:MAG: sugar phosphate isomerase/epimerase [Chloroflexota bacterium]
MIVQPDHGKRIGMSVLMLRDDLETCAKTIRDLGFEGMEVHGSHLGPDMPGVTVYEAHAAAAGDLIRRHGLMVSTLNVAGDPSFDPFGGPEAFERSVAGLATHLRLAAAMGAPRVLIWEGRVATAAAVPAALRTLTDCIRQAQERSGLADPPPVSAELHPFTFGLQHRVLPALAAALLSVGAGICLDFCHFGVALGRDLLDWITDDVLAAIDHVHYSDTDTQTSELHFPPGEGALDLDAIGARLATRPIATSWDLFGWPSPRFAMAQRMDQYAAFVTRHAAAVAGR